MVTWKPKSCPRCGGDIFVDRDMDGWCEQCLQCSYRSELKRLAELNQPVPSGGVQPERRDGVKE